jgi:hypothetical protein
VVDADAGVAEELESLLPHPLRIKAPIPSINDAAESNFFNWIFFMFFSLIVWLACLFSVQLNTGGGKRFRADKKRGRVDAPPGFHAIGSYFFLCRSSCSLRSCCVGARFCSLTFLMISWRSLGLIFLNAS